jgi:hypothetical protein
MPKAPKALKAPKAAKAKQTTAPKGAKAANAAKAARAQSDDDDKDRRDSDSDEDYDDLKDKDVRDSDDDDDEYDDDNGEGLGDADGFKDFDIDAFNAHKAAMAGVDNPSSISRAKRVELSKAHSAACDENLHLQTRSELLRTDDNVILQVRIDGGTREVKLIVAEYETKHSKLINFVPNNSISIGAQCRTEGCTHELSFSFVQAKTAILTGNARHLLSTRVKDRPPSRRIRRSLRTITAISRGYCTAMLLLTTSL